jgi:hypothetical protein
MSEEPLIGDTPRRRTGPHAPLPTPQFVAAATDAEIVTESQYAEEDPRARAARRSAELREHRGDVPEGNDKFAIHPSMIPDGWSYEWKTNTVLGAKNRAYEVSIARAGWEPVPANRHPELMPANWTGNSIEMDGMILMERPKEITDEARMSEARAARDQVRTKEEQVQQMPAGPSSPFDISNSGKPIAHGIRKSYESMSIPKT